MTLLWVVVTLAVICAGLYMVVWVMVPVTDWLNAWWTNATRSEPWEFEP